GNQLWLLRRAIQGDNTVWKFLWDVLPTLRDTLQESESLVAVAMGLGQSNSDRAWDTLEPMLTHADPAVRAAAVAAVGSLREMRARDHLRTALHGEPEAAVITQVIAALGAIGEAQDADALINYALLQPRYREAVRNALATLAAVAIPPIHNALRTTFDDTLRELLIDALRQIHLPEVVPPLSWAALHADNIKVRQQAVQALAELPYESVIPALVQALGDVSERSRTIALDALVQFGEAAVEPLLESLENPPWSPERRYLAQWAAARALARIGGETVKQRLVDLADSYDLNQRWVALTALRYADYPDLHETIIQHIPSSPWVIQHECALYLRKYPSLDAIPALMDELRQPDAATQEILEAAIVANGVAAIPILQRHSSEWQAFGQRKAIVSILKQIGHPAGLRLLEELAQD
ncbi:MAG: HEAT repeat domain-containing protein, partial [Fimbriimonadales bacterium]